MSNHGNGKSLVSGSIRKGSENLPVFQEYTQGGANISNFTGTGELSKNRNLNAASTTHAAATNSASWIPADNITQFYVTCIDVGAVSADTMQPQKDYVLMILDADNEADAQAKFSNSGGTASNVDYFPLTYGIRHGPYQCIASLTTLDFLPTIDTTRILIEAQ